MTRPTQVRIARSLLTLLLILSASLACSVQLGALPTPQAGSATSSVTFIAPAINSVLAENATILFAAKVQDSGAGVTQVEFLADDHVMGIQSTPGGQALAAYTFSQSWQAQGVRGHLISAIARRADDSVIGRADMTIQVVVSPVAGVPTIATGATPTLFIPADSTPPATTNPRQVLPTNTPAAGSVPAGGNPIFHVIVPTLNLRSGPGTDYPPVAVMKADEEATILGRNDDSTWWFVEREKMRGWVISNPAYSTVLGDVSKVPFVTTPSTPLPSATPVPNNNLAPTSTAAANADLVLDSYVLTPTEPIANQTFNIVITVRNQGTVDAPSSLLVGVFQPGSERSAMAVPPVPAGQSVVLPPMYVTLKLRAANQIGLLTLDANGEVDEGVNGEANNVRTVPYNVK
ncbi:MAG: SH3 domain-containing protein [Anaerolineae bacterium]|nr:SH3 domain-containing protein [Anaerolineae bacterium]